MMKRTIECDVCGTLATEETQNSGWPGWGQLIGIKLDEAENPHLCKACLAAVAGIVDQMKEDSRRGVD